MAVEIGRRPNRSLPPGYGIAAVLGLVLLLGGAGTGYPLLQAAVESVSLMLLAGVVARHILRPRLRLDRVEAALILLAVLLPAAQLIPIPPATWSALPGRALPAAILSAGGIARGAMPLSLDPDDTIRAMLALLPGLALFAAGRGLGAEARGTALRCVIGVAALSACLGAVQVVIGVSANAPAFASGHLGQGIGLFVNRNHQAVLMLVAICLCAPGGPRAAVRNPWLAAGLIVLFGAAILATTSRAALALLPFCLLPAITRVPRLRSAGGAAAAVLCLVVAGWVWWGGAVSRVLDRVGDGPDVRLAFWRTTWRAAQDYWPLGSGVGSFTSVYPLFERRADLAPYFVNHAHNDYLELILEGGAAAAIGLAMFGWWFVRRWRAARRAPGEIAPGIFAAIGVILAFSAVDYPLRTLSLVALFGLLCALTRPAASPPPRPMRPAARALAAILLIGGAAGAVAVAVGAARHHGDSGVMTAGQARARLARVPTDQHALTILALAVRDADARRANDLAALAGRLGWRDPATQLWLLALEADRGHPAAAVERADALLRIDRQRAMTVRLMRLATADPNFRDTLAAMLARDPPWRRTYLTRLDDLAPPLDPHAALLGSLAVQGAPPTAEENAAFVRRAIALGDSAAASRVWRAAAGAALLPDPGLRRIDSDDAARAGLFGWHETDIDGLTVAPGTSGRGPALTIDQTAGGLLLYQDLLLPPGGYRFSLPFAVEAGDRADGIGWSLTCAGSGARLDTATGQAGDRWLAIVSVPPDCPVQRLGLRSAGSGPASVTLRVGTASLQPTLSPASRR